MPEQERGRRVYTDEERAAALVELQASGGDIYRTAIRLGIPRATLARWADPEGATWKRR
jgi:transposase-like protein